MSACLPFRDSPSRTVTGCGFSSAVGGVGLWGRYAGRSPFLALRPAMRVPVMEAA